MQWVFALYEVIFVITWNLISQCIKTKCFIRWLLYFQFFDVFDIRSKTKHKKVKSSSSESTSHHIHKKSKKHKRSSHSPTPSEESDEEILDIKPLSGYIDDKKELHKEIFSLVSKKEVKDLLPPTLKVVI